MEEGGTPAGGISNEGEGGVADQVFQNKELMSLVASLSGLSINDLARFALVCRRWRDVAREPLFPFRLNQALCTGTVDRQSRPQFAWLSSLHTERVVAASAGGSHCLFLTSTGRVYGMGTNAQGRLGLTHSVHSCPSPVFVNSLEHHHIVKVEAGLLCSFAITREGRVLAFGSNTHGELGLGSNTSPVSPAIVEALAGEDIVDVSSDMHTLFLTRQGKLYSSGSGRFGQLGHDDELDLKTPQLIAAFAEIPIKMVSAGGGHSLAVAAADGQLYGWGCNVHGELGCADRANRRLPRPISFVFSQMYHHHPPPEPAPRISAVAAGRWHSLVLMSDGRCFTFGSGRGGLASHAPNNAWQPVVVPGLEDQKVLAMAGGDDHSMFITEDNSVFAVGRASRSRLGLAYSGSAAVVARAQRVVQLPHQGQPWAVTVGDGFSVVLA